MDRIILQTLHLRMFEKHLRLHAQHRGLHAAHHPVHALRATMPHVC
jgi:hypothetical protein